MPSHGKDSYFDLEDSAGTTLRNIGVYVTSTDFEQTNDTHDVTTYGDESHEFVVGLTNGTISINGLYDVTATTGSMTVLDGLVGLDDITAGFTWGPQGNGAGKPKYSGECVLSSLRTSSPVADLVTFSATLQITGAVTKGVYP